MLCFLDPTDGQLVLLPALVVCLRISLVVVMVMVLLSKPALCSFIFPNLQLGNMFFVTISSPLRPLPHDSGAAPYSERWNKRFMYVHE